MHSSARQREHPRVTPAPGSRIEVHIMGTGFLEVLHARDISVAGIGVFVAHDFVGCATDDPVELVVKLGPEKPFSARGVIVHMSKIAGDHFFGLNFTQIGDDHLDKIRRYVERRLGQGGAAG